MTTRAAASPDGRAVNRGLGVFYALVALIALAGQTGAAIEWLGWPLLFALTAVASVEFGGIVLSVYGDHRRRLGERALTARVLSAAVAGFAVAINWLGHADHLQGGFFAGMSALGYAVWILHSGARRRDQLRAGGNLPPVPPAYGAAQWLRHPGLTRRARLLALQDTTLGLYGSLDAARAVRRVERRQAAIAGLLRRKLAQGRDPLAAEIAVTVYDLDEVAARLAAGADYDGLAALLAADLTPARLATPAIDDPSSVRAAAEHEADQLRAAAARDVETIRAEALRALEGELAERRKAAEHTAPAAPLNTPPKPPANRTRRADTAISDATAKVARTRQRYPDVTQAEVAKRTGLSLRTVTRHWRANQDATGHAVEHANNGGPVPPDALDNTTEQPAAAVANPN